MDSMILQSTRSRSREKLREKSPNSAKFPLFSSFPSLFFSFFLFRQHCEKKSRFDSGAHAHIGGGHAALKNPVLFIHISKDMHNGKAIMHADHSLRNVQYGALLMLYCVLLNHYGVLNRYGALLIHYCSLLLYLL